jgi:hypothetical protein
MSLRAFHLFFIAVSVIVAAFFAAWAVERYRAANDASYLAVAAVSAAAGVGLGIYGAAFQRKMKRIAAGRHA